MPRDRANIKTNIWASTDWRRLSKDAQRLYLLLLSHPDLSYAGVCDWRPGRLAQMSETDSVEAVVRDADELERRHFVLRDDVTEEICVRSFVKHDGLLRHPQLSVSFANAYAAIASPAIREVVANEAQKLHSREPDLIAWSKLQVKTILSEPARDMTLEPLGGELAPELAPEPAPQLGASSTQARGLATTTATSTTTEEQVSSADAENATLIPDGWAPTQKHRDKAADLQLDVERAAQRFIAHARRTRRRQKSWHLSFSNWLAKDLEFERINSGAVKPALIPRAPKQTAAEAALENWKRKYGEPANEPHGDRSALGDGRSN